MMRKEGREKMKEKSKAEHNRKEGIKAGKKNRGRKEGWLKEVKGIEVKEAIRTEGKNNARKDYRKGRRNKGKE